MKTKKTGVLGEVQISETLALLEPPEKVVLKASVEYLAREVVFR
jgi:hypothetical protein